MFELFGRKRKAGSLHPPLNTAKQLASFLQLIKPKLRVLFSLPLIFGIFVIEMQNAFGIRRIYGIHPFLENIFGFGHYVCLFHFFIGAHIFLGNCGGRSSEPDGHVHAVNRNELGVAATCGRFFSTRRAFCSISSRVWPRTSSGHRA